jgi:hypothetical protein
MKVRATVKFRDRENGLKIRNKGETFEVDEERGQKLLGLGYVEEVSEETQETTVGGKG